MIGRVVSIKMTKTVAVLVEGKKTHPLYKKTYVSSKKYLADDQLGSKEGDIVVLQKIAPVSKRKHWKVVKVLGSDFVSIEQAELAEAAAEAIEEVMPAETEESVVGSEKQVASETKAKPTKEKEKLVKEKKPRKVSPKKETK